MPDSKVINDPRPVSSALLTLRNDFPGAWREGNGGVLIWRTPEGTEVHLRERSAGDV